MRFLVVIETQKVKSYLFSSPAMRETRGASVLLDLLNRKETESLLSKIDPSRYEIIYLGGGSGRVLFRDWADASDFRKNVLDLYRRETTNARVAVEIVTRKSEEGRSENFADWMSRGVAMTQQNKLGRMEGLPLVAGRWIRPCSSCGSEPAEEMLTEHGEHQLCRSCLIKRKEVKNLYSHIKRRSTRDAPVEYRWPRLKSTSELENRYTKKFIFTTLSEYGDRLGFQLHLPQDFNDIGECSKPSNYMGFIYADGNRMGEEVKKLGIKFPDDESRKCAYGAFSAIVDQATREAAVEAVMETVELRAFMEGHRFIPAEFIMAGGDDLMLVVPAHHALDVAILFISKFQEKTKKLQSQYKEKKMLPELFAECGLTTSAGVVIAHAHYPVSDLMSLSSDLMKLAKVKSAQLADALKTGAEGGDNTGTLDFMVLTEAGSEPVKDRRKKEYGGRPPYKLTERPYTVEACKEMLATIRELKRTGMPRTKLKAFYPVLFQSPMQAQFDACFIRERLKTTGNLGTGTALDKLLSSLDRLPFRKNDDGSRSTPLTEIIELYDFIQSTASNSVEEPEVING